MQDIEFNLLDEPWICVLGADCKSTQISLTDALLSAHMYVDLGGELPTQDIAILRLLLAVLYTVFSRVDEDGNEAPFEEKDDALDRWENLWQLGYFPEKPIRNYLDSWRERFWLFHPDRPFYQVNRAEIGTYYYASKLNGELSESENKLRLFQVKSGQKKERLNYDEAARWLIHLNAFDDSSNKPVPRGAGLPSTGTGWLGKLGLIQAVGNNLFETLMLNLVLFDDRQMYLNPSRPAWEMDKPREQQRSKISMPNNQAELLTLQSRRILLRRGNGFVTGYNMIGGDFFDVEDAFMELMTLWKLDKEEGKLPCYKPKLHNPDRFIWQEFNAIIPQDKEGMPGIITWLWTLQKEEILAGNVLMGFRVIMNRYGDKNSSIGDVDADELMLHANLLSEMAEAWRLMIENEVSLCTQCASRVGWFAVNLAKASGDYDRDPKEKRRTIIHESKAKARFFAAVDVPFRAWLAAQDAEGGVEARKAASQDWQNQARAIALRLGEAMIGETDNTAFVGRTVTEGSKGKEVEHHFSAPEAWLAFRRSVYKLYPIDNEAKR